jgi:hypothetical protein
MQCLELLRQKRKGGQLQSIHIPVLILSIFSERECFLFPYLVTSLGAGVAQSV